jgi:hypothetical protein
VTLRLTLSDLKRLGLTSESVVPPVTRKGRNVSTQSSPTNIARPESLQRDSHPALSGPVVVGVVGGTRHRFRWCKAWEQAISVCGIGCHSVPKGGDGVKCDRCYGSEEA